LLAVPLAAQLHGRSSVAAATIAFTVGSLTAPYVAGVVHRQTANGPLAWILCAAGMVILWPLAPVSPVMLCAAQLLSGQFMTTLEGLLDATTAARTHGSVTGALARGTAGRALGSATGTAALPYGVLAVGVSAVTGGLALALLAAAAVATVSSRRPHGRIGLPGPAVTAGASQHRSSYGSLFARPSEGGRWRWQSGSRSTAPTRPRSGI
jgi:hypothetical protein